jgi:hypothetical protein
VSQTGNATVDSPSSGGGTINPSHTRQQVSPVPSDSAAFAGGGTVSVRGVNYPKGNVAPAVGTPQSGPIGRHVDVDYAAPSASGGGFDWGDAGIGLAIGIGTAGVIVLSFVGIRRSRATPAPA